METFENEDVRKVMKERLGPEAAAAAEEIDFLPFKVKVQIGCTRPYCR